ncbi:hypothetical protein, partial [Achromobacter insuavis]|uniref:hypothetical protein n=1 Tax=Achromobacter insuavis TaxID=1287735 RepID=UPI0035A07475
MRIVAVRRVRARGRSLQGVGLAAVILGPCAVALAQGRQAELAQAGQLFRGGRFRGEAPEVLGFLRVSLAQASARQLGQQGGMAGRIPQAV